MNRLKSFFASLEKKDSKYNKIYEGAMYDPATNTTVYLPIYWDDEIGYRMERTSRKALDVMGINIMIPFQMFWSKEIQDIVLFDFVARKFALYIHELNKTISKDNGNKKESGYFFYQDINNEIHERNSCYKYLYGEEEYINIQVYLQLPVGNHKKASKIVCKQLPGAVNDFISTYSKDALEKMNQLYCLQMDIRAWLRESDYCCFIANGSRLVDSSQSGVVPFESTAEDEIEVCGVRGMGIKRGVTVLTGSGYSGKTTLLNAISGGIYNRVPGDGKELVITDESAVYIAAEDGRSIRNVDISPFIQWIPDKDVEKFSTDLASGSTSQAANVVEAMEAGSRLLLFDEDKSATNFLIRDTIMRQLIKEETIVPLADSVNSLYEQKGVSTIIVVGGSSEFLYKADTILMFDNFHICNITDSFKKEYGDSGFAHDKIVCQPNDGRKKTVIQTGFSSFGAGGTHEVLEVSALRIVTLGKECVRADKLYNVTSISQLTAIAFIVRKMQQFFMGNEGNGISMDELLDEVYSQIEEKGLEWIFSTGFTCDRWMELPRKIDVIAFINRMKEITKETGAI